MSTTTLLQVNGLSWNVGSKPILSDISFELHQGGFYGLIGPNGAGKSSLLRCLYRVHQNYRGSIQLLGKNISELSFKESASKTAVILQEQSDHLGLTVYEVVALGLTPHKKLLEWDSNVDKAQINQLLLENDLAGLADRLFANLSGGEKQRVMLARAMLQRPQFLIMDEPTNHLDLHYQLDVLKRVKKLNLTVFASFHDLNLAAAYCDQIMVMQKGSLFAHGRPEEVLTESIINQVFNTQVIVDQHPTSGKPRITYAHYDYE